MLPTGDHDANVAGSLAWSPDGTKIAFVSNTFPSSPDHYLLVYTLATRQVDEVYRVGGSCCGEGSFADPTWTNDSLTIAFSEVFHDIDQPPPAGPHLALLGHPGAATATFPNVTGDSDPDYSPTGTRWSSATTRGSTSPMPTGATAPMSQRASTPTGSRSPDPRSGSAAHGGPRDDDRVVGDPAVARRGVRAASAEPDVAGAEHPVDAVALRVAARLPPEPPEAECSIRSGSPGRICPAWRSCRR